jgi:hypothetical protein
LQLWQRRFVCQAIFEKLPRQFIRSRSKSAGERI